MFVFTGVDRALLQRSARLLEDQAKAIEAGVGGVWAGHRKDKQEFDALLRDARDLRALVKRLGGPLLSAQDEQFVREAGVQLVSAPSMSDESRRDFSTFWQRVRGLLPGLPDV